MNLGILVSREADESYLSGLAGRDKRLHCAARSEDSVGVVESDHFVVLQEVDFVQTQPLQRFVQLPSRFALCAPVDLSHHEGF